MDIFELFKLYDTYCAGRRSVTYIRRCYPAWSLIRPGDEVSFGTTWGNLDSLDYKPVEAFFLDLPFPPPVPSVLFHPVFGGSVGKISSMSP